MSIEFIPGKNQQHPTKSIRTEKSRERFLLRLVETARQETFTNYFLSGAWASQYVSRLPEDDFFTGLYLGDGSNEESSFAYFSQGTRSSPMSRRHRSLGFNEATTSEFDSITTEFNGILANPATHFSQWIPAILSHIVAIPNWEELRFNALTTSDAQTLRQAAAKLGLLSHVFSSRKTYLTDLALIKDRFADEFLASRSANSRQQIRRAIKKIETVFGPLEISRAPTADIANNWFDRLGELHLKRWNANGEATGFADSHFVRFHHSLIDGMFDSGQIDLLRITAGNEVVAYLYNFMVDNKAYFNMSGICYERFASYRPGILAHHAAIRFYQYRGMNTYNFLAGTHRYKESLATYSEMQMNIIVRRPLLKFRIEAVLRSIKRFFSHPGQ